MKCKYLVDCKTARRDPMCAACMEKYVTVTRPKRFRLDRPPKK